MCGRPGRTRIIFNHNFFFGFKRGKQEEEPFFPPNFFKWTLLLFLVQLSAFLPRPSADCALVGIIPIFFPLCVPYCSLPFSLTLTLVLFLPLLSPSPPHPLNSPALRLPCHFLRSPAPSSALLGVCVVALAPCHSSVCAAAAFPLPTPVTSLPGPFLPTFFFSPLEAGKGTLIS